MTRGYCTLTKGVNLRNTGLPKGCETQGNGVPIVVDNKNEGGQLILAKNICAVENGGINALKQLADSHFLTVGNIYQIISCKELLIAEYGATKSKVGNMTLSSLPHPGGPSRISFSRGKGTGVRRREARVPRPLFREGGGIGSDGKTYDGMNHNRVDNLIIELKSETYKPAPTRRVTRPKGNGKTQPLGIPSAKDK
jgi:phage tail tape-measure protein